MPSLNEPNRHYVLGPYEVTFETEDIGVEGAVGTEPGVLLADVTIPAASLVKANVRITTAFEGWAEVSVDAVLRAVDGLTGDNLGGPTQVALASAIGAETNRANTTGPFITDVPTKPGALLDLFEDPGPGGPLTAGEATLWFEVIEPA